MWSAEVAAEIAMSVRLNAVRGRESISLLRAFKSQIGWMLSNTCLCPGET